MKNAVKLCIRIRHWLENFSTEVLAVADLTNALQLFYVEIAKAVLLLRMFLRYLSQSSVFYKGLARRTTRLGLAVSCHVYKHTSNNNVFSDGCFKVYNSLVPLVLSSCKTTAITCLIGPTVLYLLRRRVERHVFSTEILKDGCFTDVL